MSLELEKKTEVETRLRRGLLCKSPQGGYWSSTPNIQLDDWYSLTIESSWRYYDAETLAEPIDAWEQEATIPPVEELMICACKLRYAKIIDVHLGSVFAHLLLTFDTGEKLAVFGNDPRYECWSMIHDSDGKQPDDSVYNLPGGDVTYMLGPGEDAVPLARETE